VSWENLSEDLGEMFSSLDVFDVWEGSGELSILAREPHWIPGAPGYERHLAWQREKAAKVALAEGRTPGRRGRPRKAASSPEEAARLERQREYDRKRYARKRKNDAVER
jgi:hypothetical protein